jgi:hypothetical protein
LQQALYDSQIDDMTGSSIKIFEKVSYFDIEILRMCGTRVEVHFDPSHSTKDPQGKTVASG